jgi:glycosyltransferase involved in cell wall biosynthesis/SAM-dependent methyltransferase
MPPQPILYKKLGDGPYWDFPVDSMFPIDAAGAGCVLIDMEVFDKFDEAKIPYFKENWTYEKPNGQKVNVNIGEDYWFFTEAKKLGYQPYATSKVMCDHMDYDTGIAYPGDEEVNRIRKKILEKQGLTEVLDKEEELYSVDENKKTIVFYNNITPMFDGDEIDKRPVGGAETCIINLSRELAKEYNVFVINHCKNPGIYDGVKYIPIGDIDFLNNIKTNLFVILRTPPLSNYKDLYDIDKVILWAHDFVECPCWDILPEAMPNIDKIVCLSEWHKNNIQKRFPWVEDWQFTIIGNGVDPKLFYPKKLKATPSKQRKIKLIYSSTPFRGLDVLLDAFSLVRDEVCNAELHICSSMKVYGKSDAEEVPYKHLYDKAKEMDGVIYHGSVTQKKLAKLMRESYLMAYPSTYPETYCIGTLEATSAKTPIVTTNLGALPETITKGCAIFTKPNDVESFAKAVIDLIKDKDKYKEMQRKCTSLDKTWADRAEQWKDEFFLPLTDESFLKHLKYKERLEKRKVKEGGNLNTPEYWDEVHAEELDHGIIRADVEKFRILSKEIKKKAEVLDYGCGKGELLEFLVQKRQDLKLYGYDISKVAVKHINDRLEGVSATAYRPKAKFDVIICNHLLEHLDNPEEEVDEMVKLLKPKGLLIISVPLNDKFWPEHQKIFKPVDLHNIIKNIKCRYEIILRDGVFGEEGIIFANLMEKEE